MTMQAVPATRHLGKGRKVESALLDEDARRFQALAMLASGLALAPVGVQPLQAASAPQRPAGPFAAPATPLAPRAVLVAGRAGASTPSPAQLLLPALADLPAPDRALRHAAMAAHAAAHLLHSPARQPGSALKPLGMTVVSAIEDARVERLLLRQYPGVRGWFESQLAAEPDASDLTFDAFMVRLDRILLLPASHSGNHWVHKARELFERTVREHGLEDCAAFRAAASILANDLGQMRVRMDPQHCVVPSPYRDDNSHLWEHPESDPDSQDAIALQQTSARPPPAGQPQDNAPPADQGRTTPSEAFEIARFIYPEWDRKIERMKTDWCTVVEKWPAWQGLTPTPETRLPSATRVDAMLLPDARHLDRHHRLRRQWEGDDVDLNAAIEVQVDRRLKLRPDPRLFMRSGKGPRPTSMLVLLDISESVNARGPHGQSLLDIEKQAALLLAQSSAQGVDRLAIHAFSSNTRAEVNYYRLLDFGQPVTGATKAVMHALQGRFSTRMGAALRHAGSLLQGEPQGQRTMLVVTDGAPADVDVHDDRYLIEDARHAVQEATRAGIRVCCLAVASQADEYVRHIFGWRNFGIADDAQQLASRLTRMSARLAAGR